MAERIMYEVVHPYHPDGKTLVHAPGDLLELDAVLPDGLRVKKVIADVPAPKAPAAAKPAPVKAAGSGQA